MIPEQVAPNRAEYMMQDPNPSVKIIATPGRQYWVMKRRAAFRFEAREIKVV